MDLRLNKAGASKSNRHKKRLNVEPLRKPLKLQQKISHRQKYQSEPGSIQKTVTAAGKVIGGGVFFIVEFMLLVFPLNTGIHHKNNHLLHKKWHVLKPEI